MAKRKHAEHTSFGITEKGITIQLPKSDDVSPRYSRAQLKGIIADLEAVLDDDLWAAWRAEARGTRSSARGEKLRSR